ncbi:hypothetical protein CEUSTIGMA_g465.t1 [Chlamydomonas eustigma]|uniref:Kinesin motor domain-containing protein n=1 Tax=Chlamydomonas eustigma TaxID=1157962 RepID=A0A250WQB8_9CHLO|nr:hypothetical protein CEUSTIGMA_g465.t1 [Chlamydomonas eustigma]|eukprot:GAX73013.1 hypothetical protein CEUSTIGMA_g465.t1 [Chlamydomonas eustigma]
MTEVDKPQDGVNVQVLLRCRSASEREVLERVPQVISCNEASREVTLFQNAGGKQHSRTFRFDKVFGPDSAQEKLFKQAIVPIVSEVMDGFNCTIFAYGQTGTGKTYTMEGGPRDSSDGRKLSAEAGVIPRSIKQIFDTIEAGNMDSTVKVSFLELYNEELTDLLSFEDDKDASKRQQLRLLEDRSGVVVHGLEEVIVRSATEIYQVLDRGSAKRRTAATMLNSRSSRSHSIFSITIHLKETTPEGEDIIKIGKLNLVDLAGSENISRSGAKDSRAREAGSINQSLLTLGRVITTLVEHSGHIPYRDSKLTRLLRDSLGGRTKTCIIATIAPTVQCQEETISTLDYAHRAKNIRNRPELNQKISKTTMIKDLAAEIERLKMDLTCTREKNGVYLSSERYEQGELERIQLRDAVKSLKAEMELEEATHAQQLEKLKEAHDQELDSMQSELDTTHSQLTTCQDNLNEALINLQESNFMILSLQRAEHALAVHAQSLTAQLSTCSQDLAMFYKKLDEALEVVKGDRSVLCGLKEYLRTRMEQMMSYVSDATTVHQQHLSTVTAEMTAFKEKRSRDAAAVNELMNEGQGNVSQLHTSMQQGLRQLSACLQASVQDTKNMSQSYADQAASSLEDGRMLAGNSLQSLMKDIQGQRDQVQQLGRLQESSLEVSLTSIQNLSTAAQLHLSDASSSLSELKSDVQNKQKSAEEMLKSVADAMSASAQEQKSILLKQISGMLETFAAERSNEVMNALQEVRSRLSNDSSSMAAEALRLQASTSASVLDIKGQESALAEALKSTSAELNVMSAQICDSMTAANEQGRVSLPIVMASLEKPGQLLQHYQQGLCAQLEEAVQSSSLSRQGAEDEGTSSLANILTSSKTLCSMINKQRIEDCAVADHVLTTSSEAGQKLQVFVEGCSQGTSETIRCIIEEVEGRMVQYLETSNMPSHRDLEVPSQELVKELMCPPQDVVIQMYRKEKAQILRRGGDIKYANLLVSPDLVSTSPPKGITVRGARGISSQQLQQQENQVPTVPDDSADCHVADKMDTSPVIKAVSITQSVRSKIPGAPTVLVMSPSKARSSLSDRTNYE